MLSALTGTLETPDVAARYRRMRERIARQLEAAALSATDTASRRALARLRADMREARLGGLANAVAQTSDLAKGRGVHRTGADGFSASGLIYVRTRSDRTRGAIEAYTEGASIVPRRGRWLWIATPEAGRLIGSGKSRRRLTPDEYRKAGSPMGQIEVDAQLWQGSNRHWKQGIRAVENQAEICAKHPCVEGAPNRAKLSENTAPNTLPIDYVYTGAASQAAAPYDDGSGRDRAAEHERSPQ